MAEIQINSLSKSFGKSKVIKDISLSIQSRSFTVIVGPSGCGKSTLLRMIAGLEKIDTGEIKIAGKSVNDLPPKNFYSQQTEITNRYEVGSFSNLIVEQFYFCMAFFSFFMFLIFDK